MKILLLGSNGQVGWEINRKANAAGLNVIALNRAELDITRHPDVKLKISEIKPDVVINATAYTAVDQAEKEPDLAFAVNRDAVRNLAQVCDLLDVVLIHFSTDYIFDGEKNEPYIETDSANPLNVYGESKWLGEEDLRNYLQKHIVLRISWVFGRHGKNFVKTIITLAGEKTELRVVADQFGCPTPAEEVATNIVSLLANIKNKKANFCFGTFHFCCTPVISWCEFAKAIIEYRKKYVHVVCESVKPITTSEFKSLAQRPTFSVLDCNKVVESLHFNIIDWGEKVDSIAAG